MTSHILIMENKSHVWNHQSVFYLRFVASFTTKVPFLDPKIRLLSVQVPQRPTELTLVQARHGAERHQLLGRGRGERWVHYGVNINMFVWYITHYDILAMMCYVIYHINLHIIYHYVYVIYHINLHIIYHYVYVIDHINEWSIWFLSHYDSHDRWCSYENY